MNANHWKDKFGDDTGATEGEPFGWTRFYEEMANKLLAFKEDRQALIQGINEVSAECQGLTLKEGVEGANKSFRDICPFTVMGLFNRGNTDAKRRDIAGHLAQFLGVEEALPTSFDGIHCISSSDSWSFSPKGDQSAGHVDAMWALFASALGLADVEGDRKPEVFIQAYDDVLNLSLRWKQTIGLHWIRPWNFPSLDYKSRPYVLNALGVKYGRHGKNGICAGKDYVQLMDDLENRFLEDSSPARSFPELALQTWKLKKGEDPSGEEGGANDNGADEDSTEQQESYGIGDIISDGCFIPVDNLEGYLDRLKDKKNVILQGPPGTGKTWLGKRLAYALIGERNDHNVRAVQFHPNLSYEDFIRGWRPSGEGRLTLVDGPFLEMASTARDNPDSTYVIVIEEINRGNPAQIFGEMLTLLEADKRTPAEALQLSYKLAPDERVYIPGNLYVIGTMNIADRSLALVDLALRRRFAFIDLVPTINQTWKDCVGSQFSIDSQTLDDIQGRMLNLNNTISDDTTLGAQYRVGHSYVTPAASSQINDPRQWFRQVVETEISPLLEEYWFDNLEKAHTAKQQLLEGF